MSLVLSYSPAKIICRAAAAKFLTSWVTHDCTGGHDIYFVLACLEWISRTMRSYCGSAWSRSLWAGGGKYPGEVATTCVVGKESRCVRTDGPLTCFFTGSLVVS